MENVIGIINLANERDFLSELTTSTCSAAVPFGGRYRLIDFVLSNMVNSDLANIALFTHDKYYSLLEHIGTGREWDLDRNKEGLSVFPPLLSFMRDYQGDVENYTAYLDYFKKSSQDYVLISGSTTVCKIDYRHVFAYHLKKEADITFVCKKNYPLGDKSDLKTLRCNKEGRVSVMTSEVPRHKENITYMQTMLISKKLFLELIGECQHQNKFAFLEDMIIPLLEKLKVYAYKFDGYIGAINTLDDYYHHSMELLNSQVSKELFDKAFPFYTKAKSDPPAKYSGRSQVANSLVANGCVIEGKVENSILFWGVKVAPGAHVKNSILLPNCKVGNGAKLENIILDKEIHISEHEKLLEDKLRLITAI